MALVCAGDVMLEVVVTADEVAEQGGETQATMMLRVGGQALNVARVFTQLGGESLLAAAIGKDAAGNFLLQELSKLGIRLIHPQVNDNSGIVLSFVHGQHRTMYTQRGANHSLNLNIPALGTPRPYAWYFSGYLPLNPGATAQIQRHLNHLAKTQTLSAVDTPPAQVLRQIGADVFLRTFAGSKVLLATEDEAHVLTAVDTASQAARRLHQRFPLVVIKQGPKGCWLQTGHGGQQIATTPLTQVDPTGAGDAFCGAFLFALLRRKKPEQAAAFAHKVAARTISRKVC